MKTRRKILITSLMFLFSAYGGSWAALDKEEQAKVDTLAVVLQLSAKQKADVIKEREKSKHALLQLEKKWQQLHDRLRAEVRKNEPDQSVVDDISAQIGKIQGEMVALRANSLIYLKSIITPQQAKLIEGRPTDTSVGSGK
jgi:hypothetical protein